MKDSNATPPETPGEAGGEIPGAPGVAAFSVSRRAPSAIPVLVAVPHAGRTYPPSLLARMRDPARAGMRLEDRYADLLARRIVQETGAALIVAHAPRAMIDLNRAPSSMRGWPEFTHPITPRWPPSWRSCGDAGAAPC